MDVTITTLLLALIVLTYITRPLSSHSVLESHLLLQHRVARVSVNGRQGRSAGESDKGIGRLRCQATVLQMQVSRKIDERLTELNKGSLLGPRLAMMLDRGTGSG